MNNHSFGEASTKQYNTLHPDLQLIVLTTLKECEVDFSLLEGYRSPDKQLEYFSQGRTFIAGKWVITDPKKVITNIDGYKIKGNHNYNPSLAVDINIYVPDKPMLNWDKIHLAYVAGSMMRVAERLLKEGKVVHKLRWGCDWDGDGDLADNKLYDFPHFEIY